MKASKILVFLSVFLSACQTIPYNEKGAEVVSAYGDAADRFIVGLATATDKCKATGTPMTQCANALFSTNEESFYDEWDSKIFSAQNQVAADDALGICSGAADTAKKLSSRVTDAMLKREIDSIDFSKSSSCSMGSIGGVLKQHRNLRAYHKEFVVIERDEGDQWRETIAQSVRIALMLENFKKTAAEDGTE
ncbi:MAG: hypothetical protein RH982_10490 [Parvibaculum sp.]